jgi:FtsZ-interacting cell division protein ZipA
LSNEDFNSSSRSGYRSKRKKTNLVLNSLIIIILLLIVFVAYTIFSSGSNKASSKKENPITAEKTSQKNSKEKQTVDNKDQSTNQSTNQSTDQSSNPSNDAQQSADASTPATVDQSQAVVTKGDSSSNVQKSIQNPAWKGVGTSQTGTHTPTYDTNSVDWQEMLNAISYATGLEQSNMIVQFLGRDRTTENASVGTVYSRDKQQKYKVYIHWVDGEGWKPTKVEELSK